MSTDNASFDRTSTANSAALVELVALMVNQHGMAATVIDQHVDDGTGHCRTCTAGAQTGRYTWPCLTYLAARRAAGTTSGAAAVKVARRNQPS